MFIGLVGLVAAILLFTSGCSGPRPTLAAASSLELPESVVATSAKMATVDDKVVDQSLVATAIVPTVQIYDSPFATEPVRSLDNPNSVGGPLVFLVDSVQGDWLVVLLPVRPNGSTGYIRRSDVTLSQHTYRIEVRLSEFTMTVTRGGEPIYDFTVGVAKENTPTPGGRYYTTELLRPPTADSVYGTYAYGLSGYSESFTTFNGGPGQLGIHGTNDPTSIGRQVSSGCVRLNNADIEQLAGILPLGVPVDIIT